MGRSLTEIILIDGAYASAEEELPPNRRGPFVYLMTMVMMMMMMMTTMIMTMVTMTMMRMTMVCGDDDDDEGDESMMTFSR